jgi:hypothetical protein
MPYDDLDDDVLLQIAWCLDDYLSLLSWSQVSSKVLRDSRMRMITNRFKTSRRHRLLLLTSKQTMLAIVRNWNFLVPLSLPVHIPESALTTADIHEAIRRAIISHRFWNKPYMSSTLFEPTPLVFQRDFPGSRLLSAIYFDSPGLIILLLNDGDTGHGGKYVALYQVSPPKKLAVWDTGDGEVCSTSS